MIFICILSKRERKQKKTIKTTKKKILPSSFSIKNMLKNNLFTTKNYEMNPRLTLYLPFLGIALFKKSEDIL